VVVVGVLLDMVMYQVVVGVAWLENVIRIARIVTE
jgi:hypothetical protein